MTRLRLAAFALATTAAALWFAYASGCAHQVDDEPDPTSTAGAGGAGGGTGGSEGGAGGQGGFGGAGGPAPPCLPLGGVVLALDEIFMGDTDWTGTPSADAWRQYGFDLDSLTTTGGDLTGHCQPQPGAPASNVDDGDNGIDNSFGRNVLPEFLSMFSDLPQQLNDNINNGVFTLLMHFEGLGPDPDQDPVPTKLYGGAPLGSMPAWDGTDCWLVLQEQLDDPTDLASAKTQFPTASLSADLWSSGSTGTVIIPLNFGSTVQEIRIEQARLTLQMAPSHQGAALGQLGGVLDTEQFIEIIRDVLGAIDVSFCSGAIFDDLATQIRQSSDIMKDGSQDPGATCDGISVGMGFTMLAVGIDGIADPAPALPDPCP